MGDRPRMGYIPFARITPLNGKKDRVIHRLRGGCNYKDGYEATRSYLVAVLKIGQARPCKKCWPRGEKQFLTYVKKKMESLRRGSRGDGGGEKREIEIAPPSAPLPVNTSKPKRRKRKVKEGQFNLSQY